MLIKNVRLSFPHLFQAHAFEKGQPEKFTATFILEPGSPQVEVVRKAILATAVAKWGDSNGNLPDGLSELLATKPCLRKSETKRNKDGSPMDGFEAGGTFFNASNSVKPTVIDAYGRALDASAGVVYAGCYVNAIVEFWAQDHQRHGRRINASLGGVQYHGDGAAFGGGRPASVDEFDIADNTDALAAATEAAAPPPPQAASAAQASQASVADSLFI